jgi:signal transduction histidine kinase
MEAALAFNRAQLVRAESEQARIARDLHDGVIQSIYAVGMRIEECRRLANSSPETAREKLATTSEVLNHVIRDMRGFLTGLEPASIQGRELKTALKSVLLGLGDEATDRIALDIDPRTAEALTSKEATELFHLCKEALSNSLRHGLPGRVLVKMQRTAEGCQVEITDDGRGFDPAVVPPEAQGLRNMNVRARNLGARLQLTTAPGAGTRLVVILPKT